MNDSRGVISEKFGRVLIIICCLTYASAYLGRLSAMLDAFCYLGSSIATYTFGAVAEKSGWTAVLIMISVISVIGGVSALIGSRLVRRDSLTDELL